MTEISLTLDGEKIVVKTGATLLEAAQQAGIEIPTLCHDPRLKPTAACRVCLVEVEGARGPMPACTTPVTDGMVARTRTEDIINIRRMALELMLSDHVGDCIAPCQRTCPAGIDIQGYIAHIANGQYLEALKLIKKTNPLPLVCGRVCPRFCETECRRNLVDEPVAINMLKRFAADCDINSAEPFVPTPKIPTGKWVAVIGGGPAGLTAAYYLALEGHEVTLFDSNPKLGGMLRYGIPEYRLPKAVLDKEIAIITGLCRRVKTGVSLGKDFTIASLKAEGYQAVFIGIGAWANQTMGIDGEDSAGVLSGIGFLYDVAQGEKVALGDKVAVIGGGNTAIDAARTALRLGAGEVTIVYRRSRTEMPANDEEVEQAEEEGVRFQFLTAPIGITSESGKLKAMQCTRMELGEPDASGRRRPQPVTGSEFTLTVDTVIAAIGQKMDKDNYDSDSPVGLSRWGYINVDDETMLTSEAGIFAGGDCTAGPATAVQAIGAGRRAVLYINKYLNGDTVMPETKRYDCTKGKLAEMNAADYADEARLPRSRMPALEPDLRKSNFKEIELGLDEKTALSEAERCLACGCRETFDCKLRQLATEYQVSDTRYSGVSHHLKIDKNEHPYIIRDMNKCILCGRCVRICSEVMGIGAYGFTNRGFAAMVEPTLGMPLGETNCVDCSQCVSACPTGAISAGMKLPKSGPWEVEVTASVCPYCGIGCNLELNTVGDKLVEVTSAIDSPVNGGNLCRKGAFQTGDYQSPGRLTKPMIKKAGKLVESSWEEALELASAGLKRVRDSAGGEALAVIASPELTNEELYLAQKLGRLGLNTANLAGLGVAPVGLKSCLGKNAAIVTYDDVIDSDLIITFDCDLPEEFPIIELKVRKAIAGGSRLVSFTPRTTRLDVLAHLILKVNSRNSAELLKAMLSHVIADGMIDNDFVKNSTSGFDALSREVKGASLDEVAAKLWTKPDKIIEVLKLYTGAKRPVIIINADTIAAEELTLLTDLALITGKINWDGAGILAMHSGGNAQGLIDMGMSAEADVMNIVETGKVQGLLVLGGANDSAMFKKPRFSVLLSAFVPKKLPYPDVILPAAAFIESAGSYTNCEGRVQALNRALKPPAGKANWEIIAALGRALDCPMDYNNIPDIQAEIAKLVAGFNVGEIIPFGDSGKFNFPDGLARLCLDAGRGEESR